MPFTNSRGRKRNYQNGVSYGSERLCLKINATRLLPLDVSMLCGVVELEQELCHGAGHLGSAPGRPGGGLYQKQVCLQIENKLIFSFLPLNGPIGLFSLSRNCVGHLSGWPKDDHVLIYLHHKQVARAISCN